MLPTDVGTARQLWWAVIGFGVVQLIAGILAALGDRSEYAAQMVDEMGRNGTRITMATADLMVSLAFAVAAVLGLALAALASLFVYQLGKGKRWARTLLTVAGVWLVMMAIGAMFTLDAVGGTAALVAGGAAIVQGVLAAGAVFLCHRQDSNAYFQNVRR